MFLRSHPSVVGCSLQDIETSTQGPHSVAQVIALELELAQHLSTSAPPATPPPAPKSSASQHGTQASSGSRRPAAAKALNNLHEGSSTGSGSKKSRAAPKQVVLASLHLASTALVCASLQKRRGSKQGNGKRHSKQKVALVVNENEAGGAEQEPEIGEEGSGDGPYQDRSEAKVRHRQTVHVR